MPPSPSLSLSLPVCLTLPLSHSLLLPLGGVGVPYGSSEKWKWIGDRQERNLSFLGSDVGICVRDELKSDPRQQNPHEQDTSTKGALAVVRRSPRSESDEEEEEGERWGAGGVEVKWRRRFLPVQSRVRLPPTPTPRSLPAAPH